MDGYDLFTNLLAVGFGGLLMYFPPRIFYLAEDIKKPKTLVFYHSRQRPGHLSGHIWEWTRIEILR